MILETISLILLVSLSTASVLLFLSKPNWGPREGKYSAVDWYQAHRRPWMPERCEPCFSLWIGTLILLCLTPFYGLAPLLGALAVPPIAIFFYQYLKQ